MQRSGPRKSKSFRRQACLLRNRIPLSVWLPLDGLDVCKILRPTCSSFVLDQRHTPDHRNFSAFQCEARPLRNSFIESDPVSAVQNIDAPRGQPDLEDPTVSHKIFSFHLETTERRSKVGKRSVYALRIASVGANQHVHVFSSARVAMKGNRMATHQNEFRPNVRKL